MMLFVRYNIVFRTPLLNCIIQGHDDLNLFSLLSLFRAKNSSRRPLESKLVSSTTLSFSLLRPRSLPFSLKFHTSFSLKSPTSTFRAFSDAEEDEEDDEEKDQDQDNVSADEYDDVLGEASDEADVFARHGGFKWQRVDKLCNEVREFGADLIDVDELTSVVRYDILFVFIITRQAVSVCVLIHTDHMQVGLRLLLSPVTSNLLLRTTWYHMLASLQSFLFKS
ncbi:hypothetical protein GmHk_07G019904 [Glycine max]|nr:hypothetical protein GmHk_07G019904 [Glycine max]